MAKLQELKTDQLVEVYVQLRDKRAQRKAAYENDDADDKSKQERVESELLRRFQESGMESVRTKSGTAYKSIKTSATIADWDEFFQYVVENQAWELVGRHCSKDGVKEYKEANSAVPPGINWREELTVNVRRS